MREGLKTRNPRAYRVGCVGALVLEAPVRYLLVAHLPGLPVALPMDLLADGFVVVVTVPATEQSLLQPRPVVAVVVPVVAIEAVLAVATLGYLVLVGVGIRARGVEMPLAGFPRLASGCLRMLPGGRFLLLRASGPFVGLGAGAVGLGLRDLRFAANLPGLMPACLMPLLPALPAEQEQHRERYQGDQHDGDDQTRAHMDSFPRFFLQARPTRGPRGYPQSSGSTWFETAKLHIGGFRCPGLGKRS